MAESLASQMRTNAEGRHRLAILTIWAAMPSTMLVWKVRQAGLQKPKNGCATCVSHARLDH